LDGEKVDGVTTLIGQGIPKPALINWAGNTTAAYAVDHWTRLDRMPPAQRLEELRAAKYKERDEAARRGTEVHKLADRIIHGQSVDVPEALADHVDSYVRFCDLYEPIPVLTEFTVGNRRWGYAGTSDLVVEIRGRRYIVEIKTSRSGIYGEAALQLAGYRYAEFYLRDGQEVPMAELDIQGALGLWVRPDRCEVLPIQAGEREFRDFLHAAWIARWSARSAELIGSPLTPEAMPV
jgi:hypothetical protein